MPSGMNFVRSTKNFKSNESLKDPSDSPPNSQSPKQSKGSRWVANMRSHKPAQRNLNSSGSSTAREAQNPIGSVYQYQPDTPDSELPQVADFSDMDDGNGMVMHPSDMRPDSGHARSSAPPKDPYAQSRDELLSPYDQRQGRPQNYQAFHHPTRSSSRNAANYAQSSPPREQANAVHDGDISEMRSVAGPYDHSSGDSIRSQETAATSIHTLPPLQAKGPDNSDARQLEPVIEDDPRSWDLIEPHMESENEPTGFYALEERSMQLFSPGHLRMIFKDPKFLLKFTGFLNTHRPKSIAMLIYYLDALKALRAITYANAIAEALEPIQQQGFTEEVARPTHNAELEDKAAKAFAHLVREDLPAYITHTWIEVVSVSVQRRITGTLAPHLREASEGLAEVFCLTDPNRPDNPIIFASEEFTRTTQYGLGYVIGRNCRFLQGPQTNRESVRRLSQAIKEKREHSEVLLNYRRDGSPFMNLLLTAPLMDSRGNVRYIIGAQVDVSGLAKDCSDLDSLARLVKEEKEEASRRRNPQESEDVDDRLKKDEFQDLAAMFNRTELETVRKSGGRMHKEYVDDQSDAESIAAGRRRVLLKDPSQDVIDQRRQRQQASAGSQAQLKERLNGRLEGVYQHYLLVRPAPSLRILFTSPSLRVPGILQSPFLNRIGGSPRVRADLETALTEGRGVTARIRWMTRADEQGDGEGRPRWIHCTPLVGHTGAVGVWMVVLVEDEEDGARRDTGRRFRQAPPVSGNIGGKEWEAGKVSEERQGRLRNKYDLEAERSGGGMSRSTYRSPPRDLPYAGGDGRGRAGSNGTAGESSDLSFQLR